MMLLKNIEPFVRTIVTPSMTINSKNDVFTELQTSDCRLFYIVGGNGKMTVSGKDYPLRPGCAILFQSGTKYTWHVCENGVSFIAVNFDYTMNFSYITNSFHPTHSVNFTNENILESIKFEDADILNTPIYLENATLLEANLRTMASESYLKNQYTTELLSSCLKFIIINIVRLSQMQQISEQSRSYDIVRRVIQYIENNYDKDLCNETIGEYIHFNPSYLNRIFKQHTGHTIHGFLVRYRMNLAMDLLHTNSSPINEIAISVGFSDIPHFIKSFKKFTGKTPREYRSQSKTIDLKKKIAP